MKELGSNLLQVAFWFKYTIKKKKIILEGLYGEFYLKFETIETIQISEKNVLHFFWQPHFNHE